MMALTSVYFSLCRMDLLSSGLQVIMQRSPQPCEWVKQSGETGCINKILLLELGSDCGSMAYLLCMKKILGARDACLNRQDSPLFPSGNYFYSNCTDKQLNQFKYTSSSGIIFFCPILSYRPLIAMGKVEMVYFIQLACKATALATLMICT